MSDNTLEYLLNNEDLDKLLQEQDSLFNANEISVGSNDIVDRRTYIPGDEKIINEIADKMGLSD